MSDAMLDVCLCGDDGEITVYSHMQKALRLGIQPTTSCKYLGEKNAMNTYKLFYCPFPA